MSYKKRDTRDERIKIFKNPPHSQQAFSRLFKFIVGFQENRCGAALTQEEKLAALDKAHLIVRSHIGGLSIWAAFVNSHELCDSSFDPSEWEAYARDKDSRIRHHAEKLLTLLNDPYQRAAVTHAICETKAATLLSDGHIGTRTIERSLQARLTELIAAIPNQEANQLQEKTPKGKGAARRKGTRSILQLWLEVTGEPPPKFKRKGSGGGPCGEFSEFVQGVLEAMDIRGPSLEVVTRDAIKMFDDMAVRCEKNV